MALCSYTNVVLLPQNENLSPFTLLLSQIEIPFFLRHTKCEFLKSNPVIVHIKVDEE